MNGYKISPRVVETLRHILDARIDNASDATSYTAWTSARDIFEYALANNFDCLKEFDYLPAVEDVDFEKEW